MSKDKDRAIVVKRVRAGKKAGHHGGAWKLAYADFMTAMMAFFLLMWLLSSASHGAVEGHRRLLQPAAEDHAVGRRSQRRGLEHPEGRRPRYLDRRARRDALERRLEQSRRAHRRRTATKTR